MIPNTGTLRAQTSCPYGFDGGTCYNYTPCGPTHCPNCDPWWSCGYDSAGNALCTDYSTWCTSGYWFSSCSTVSFSYTCNQWANTAPDCPYDCGAGTKLLNTITGNCTDIDYVSCD